MATSLIIDPETLQRAKARAKREGTNFSHIMRMFAVQYASEAIDMRFAPRATQFERVEVDEATQQMMDQFLAQRHALKKKTR